MAKGNFHKAGSIKRVSQKSLHSILERPPAEYILAGFLDKENGFGVTLLNQAKVIFPLAGKGLGAERMIETDECLAWMGICGRDVMGEVGCG